MIPKAGLKAALAAAMLLMSAACREGPDAAANASQAMPTVEVTVATGTATHRFNVEIARTPQEQERGLMYRTGIPADGGMLFAPYPAAGGGPREARFWMKNTPSPLDLIFIRPDGTIARIAENTVPFSEEHVTSGEPVSAVLEINGGRSAELGIAPGDRASWPGQGG